VSVTTNIIGTLELNWSWKFFGLESNMRLQLTLLSPSIHFSFPQLDTAGQEDYVSLRDTSIRRGKAFMLVYSVTSRESFDQVQGMYESILRCKVLIDGMECWVTGVPVGRENNVINLKTSL